MIPVLANSWPDGDQLLLVVLVVVGLPLAAWAVLVLLAALASVGWFRATAKKDLAVRIAPPLVVTGMAVVGPPVLGAVYYAVTRIPSIERPPPDCQVLDVDWSLIDAPCDPADGPDFPLTCWTSARYVPEGEDRPSTVQAFAEHDCQCPLGWGLVNNLCRPPGDEFPP